MAMTLRQKISWQIGAMLIGLLLLSGASLWGIDALHQDYGFALDGYQRLRQAYVAGTHLSTAQKLLQWPHQQALLVANAEVRSAVTDFDPLTRPGVGWDAAAAAQVQSALQTIATQLDLLERTPGDTAPPEAIESQRDAIVAQIGHIGQLSAGIRHATEAAQASSDARRRTIVGILTGLCGVVVLCAIVLGVLHYRGVMGPVHRLTAGVRRLAAGQFKGRVDAHGKDELAILAQEFNRMAEELDGFYHELERKVAEKSKELIRSERLASVGYLAAGVAHEINNPLGIISGYAEFSLAELRRKSMEAAERGATDEVERSLKIICDEAFRCKDITQKLLSLARGGDEGRKPVSLLIVANEVASIIGGLREHREKRLIVRAESGDDSQSLVLAIEQEMKQVVLNLAVNALEAVPAGSGQVQIDVRRANDWVELAVSDNGRGMTTDTLERAFEPFYTEKRGAREDGRHGTGLGLSITHAIVQSHGGAITARSNGPGSGSRFIVRLPAAGLNVPVDALAAAVAS